MENRAHNFDKKRIRLFLIFGICLTSLIVLRFFVTSNDSLVEKIIDCAPYFFILPICYCFVAMLNCQEKFIKQLLIGCSTGVILSIFMSRDFANSNWLPKIIGIIGSAFVVWCLVVKRSK